MTRWHVRHGDALEVLRELEAGVFDAMITDPPAGIAFMNAHWDEDKGGRVAWIAWLRDIMIEARRVLKPGAHALVWALPRTSHWTATALEDAGFEIRDVGVHLFGQGFPKSHNVSKAIDKAAGATREVIGSKRLGGNAAVATKDKGGTYGVQVGTAPAIDVPITAPSTDAAKQWDGWGTALKPGSEHWILARAPMRGTVAANVAEHGTGALNIDATRIFTDWNEADRPASWKASGRSAKPDADKIAAPPGAGIECHPLGRWPANVTLDEDAAALLDAQSGTRKSGTRKGLGYGGAGGDGGPEVVGNEGGASRFFYCAKASTRERGEGNKHPTVKPLALMRWLVRLITPKDGLVLDPFSGSCSTGIAALAEDCYFFGVEKEAEYAELARKRITESCSS